MKLAEQSGRAQHKAKTTVSKLAMTRPCIDEKCMIALPPKTSYATAWNTPVINGNISKRDPAFPVRNIKIKNPKECNNNRFLYIATQIEYADGYSSSVVSADSAPIDWCSQNDDTNDSLKLELETSSNTINCNDEIALTIKLINYSKDKDIELYSAWIIPAINIAIEAYDMNLNQLPIADIGYFKHGNNIPINITKLYPYEFVGRRFIFKIADGIFYLKNPKIIEKLPEILKYEIGKKDFYLEAQYNLSIPMYGVLKILASNKILIHNNCKRK